MRTQQDLQVALRERYRRLLVAGYHGLSHETEMTYNWILAQPALAALLKEAARAEPELDIESWRGSVSRGLEWPCRTEAGRAALAWSVFTDLAHGTQRDPMRYAMRTGSSSNLNDKTRALVEKVYEPLFNYLIDHVSAGSSVLFTLDRFVRNVEWFTRTALYDEYSADTANGEAVYDRELRRFLFAEGINMPFSQAKGPSGVSDVLTGLETEDPLVCEVKLFTGDKRPVATGLNQAVLYAQDHGKSTAYLIVINLTDRALDLPTDGDADQKPHHLDVAGVRIYLLPIRALPPANSASKSGKPKPVTFTYEDLTTSE